MHADIEEERTAVQGREADLAGPDADDLDRADLDERLVDRLDLDELKCGLDDEVHAHVEDHGRLVDGREADVARDDAHQRDRAVLDVRARRDVLLALPLERGVIDVVQAPTEQHRLLGTGRKADVAWRHADDRDGAVPNADVVDARYRPSFHVGAGRLLHLEAGVVDEVQAALENDGPLVDRRQAEVALADADDVDRAVGEVALRDALDLLQREVGIVVEVLPGEHEHGLAVVGRGADETGAHANKRDGAKLHRVLLDVEELRRRAEGRDELHAGLQDVRRAILKELGKAELALLDHDDLPEHRV
eukprot:3905113-Prymnesium_polylepis.1